MGKKKVVAKDSDLLLGLSNHPWGDGCWAISYRNPIDYNEKQENWGIDDLRQFGQLQNGGSSGNTEIRDKLSYPLGPVPSWLW